MITTAQTNRMMNANVLQILFLFNSAAFFFSRES